MSESYDKIIRQVALRGNLIEPSSASAMETNYTTALFGSTQLGNRAIEYPITAIYDAILSAGDRLIGLIGLDKNSPYRPHFNSVTSSVATGAVIPLVDSTSKSRVGVIGDVRDASTSKKLVAKDYQEVIGYSNLTLKQTPHWYFTDNVRIWHTRSNVTLDIVVWDKVDQLTLMAQTSGGAKGNCPFPQDLHEALVCGALSYIFRGDFNSEQVGIWRQYFNDKLQELGAHLSSDEVEKRKLTE